MMIKTELNILEECPLSIEDSNPGSIYEYYPVKKLRVNSAYGRKAVNGSAVGVGQVTSSAGEVQADHAGPGNNKKMGDGGPGQSQKLLDYRHIASPPAKHGLRTGLPLEGYIRLPQVLEVIPISKSSWWAGVKSGRYPPSMKLGPRTTVWHVDDIRRLIQKSGAAA